MGAIGDNMDGFELIPPLIGGGVGVGAADRTLRFF
jgi:hypothetical protein